MVRKRPFIPMRREKREKMRLNPILKRELRVQGRGYGLLGLFCAVNILLFLCGILGSLAVVSRMRRDFEADYGAMLYIYALLKLIMFLMILIISPSLTAGSISGERSLKTLDLLLTTRMTPFSIILGKLASAFCMTGILIVSAIPALTVPLMYGGAGPLDVAVTLLSFLISAFMLLSMGIFAGSFEKSMQKSTALAYGMLLILLAGTVIPGVLTAPFYEESMNDPFTLLLLFNPLVTEAAVVTAPLSGSQLIGSVYERLGFSLGKLSDVYIPLALFMELMMGAIFMLLAVRNITPAGLLRRSEGR